MTSETIYQEPEFTSWILAQTPDYIIDVLSADKADFHSLTTNTKNQTKMNNTLRKKKILIIAKNKKRIFDLQKMLVPKALYTWSVLEDDPVDFTKIDEIIIKLYEESGINDRQQLATQLYFVRSFKEAHTIFLESKANTEDPAMKLETTSFGSKNDLIQSMLDKKAKKLSKEIEKKKEELSTLRTKNNAEIKQLKESLNSKKTELFELKKVYKTQEDELKFYKTKYQEELENRSFKEEQLNKAHLTALDKKDAKIQALENEITLLKKAQINVEKQTEAPAITIPLIDSSKHELPIDESLLSKLAATMKNRPDKLEGYSVVKEKEQIINSPVKRTQKMEKMKVVLLGNPRNSTVLSSHSYEMSVFENEQCQQFIAAAKVSELVYLFEPRYLPEEFDRLATAEVKNKAILIHSFADLKQTLGAL